MKIYINFKFLLPFFIFALKIIIIHTECNKDTPILTSTGCKMQYCTKAQFTSGECSVNNTIIKTQWLNDIILLDYDKFRYGSFTINSKGDMIYECSVENTKIRLFYWIKSDGSFQFENENGEKMPTKTILVQNADGDANSFPKRYESQIVSVLVNNIGEYLITISLWEGYMEYYDLENIDYSFIYAMDFTNYDIHSYVGNLNEIKNGDTREYWHTFIGQDKNDRSQNNFYLICQKYSFSSNRLQINSGYSIEGKIKKNIDKGAISRMVSTFKINSNLYVFFYLNKNYGNNNIEFIIELYNNNFQSQNSLAIGNIEGEYEPYRYEGVFSKGINIKNNLGVFIYYKSNTNLCPRIRIYEINSYSFTEKFDFTLNSPGDLNTGPILNDMIKISDKRFSFIGSSNDREKLYIILFDFYDSDRKIKERIYKINLYSLYNYKIYRELTTIRYNNYLTLSASACNSYPCDKDDKNSNYFSFIIIF